MLHSVVAAHPVEERSMRENGVRLWCELLVLHFDKAGITSRSLERVIGRKWRTVKKRLKSGNVDFDEIKVLLEHCGIDPWLAMIAVGELKRPEAYFEAEIVWTAESAQCIIRTILERLNALNGDFIPLRKGLVSQTAKLVDDLFAYQRCFQDLYE